MTVRVEPSSHQADGEGQGGSASTTLAARGVVVRYGPRVAVDGVDLHVGRGEILGLLGPNGAGKTSLLRRLAGLITGGSVLLDGADPATDADARARIGYLPEDPPLYSEDTALAYVAYLSGLCGVPRREQKQAAATALERVGAADLARRLIGRLSKGQRQRVALAGAIAHHPHLLLLDEPSDGLDPRQVVSFRGLLRELRPDTAIVFSTHLLAEAQSVCDRVVVVDRGRVVLDRPVASPTLRLRVEVHGANTTAVRTALAAVAGVRAVAGDLVEVDDEAVADAISAMVVGRGWRLRHLAPAPDDLETAFLGSLREQPGADPGPETSGQP